MRPLLEQESEEIRALLEGADSREQRAELRDDVRAIHQRTRTAIEAELSEEQIERYAELREQARARARRRRP